MRTFSSFLNWTIGILAGTLFLYACSTTLDIGGEIETIGASGGFTFKSTPTEATIQTAPPGETLDIQCRDAEGNPIGAPITGVGAGDTFPIPPGATHGTASPSSETICATCTVDSLTVSGLRRPATPHSLNGPGAQQTMLVLPFRAQTSTAAPGFGPLSNTYASFSFQTQGQTADQLWARVAPIVLAPIGAFPAVPLDTTVNFYSKVIPSETGPLARLFVAAPTLGFEWFTFKLNDQIIATQNYHSDTHVYPNGWKVIEARVSESDVQGDGSEDFSVIADTVEGDANGLFGSATYQLQ